MEAAVDNTSYKERRPFILVIGIVLLLIGIGAALLGPLEMYCFYLFSEGGRFHYEGFGFGSFMFGNIASQIIGYYLIALAFIPLGYGHLRTRRWARTLSLAGLGFWLVVGAPLSVVFVFILLASKEVSPAGALIAVVLVALSYLGIPGALIWFYGTKDVRSTFETRDPRSYWIVAKILGYRFFDCRLRYIARRAYRTGGTYGASISLWACRTLASTR